VGKVNFGPLLLGGKNKETIKLRNLEDVSIPFSFLKESVRGDVEYADSLIVHPMSGIINADSDVNIEVIFTPKVEKSFNYNLICNVKRKSIPVSLNVKGIGYILHHNVYYNHGLSALNSNEIQNMDFQDIYINEKKIKYITIENRGDFNFDFTIKKL
jgi:hydrocephalus-inducing protein